MNRLRASRWPRGLGVLALLSQLLLGEAHALDLARRYQGPLLYAYCGSPTGLRALAFRSARVPAPGTEPRTPDHAVTPYCELCSGVHGVHLAGSPSTPPVPAWTGPAREIEARGATVQASRRVWRPLPRAPPGA